MFTEGEKLQGSRPANSFYAVVNLLRKLYIAIIVGLDFMPVRNLHDDSGGEAIVDDLRRKGLGFPFKMTHRWVCCATS